MRGIGPGRAERIVQYREEVKAISSSAELALVAGMSLRQAEALNADIDWSTFESMWLHHYLPIPALVWVGGIIVYGGYTLLAHPASPTALLYACALGMWLTACLGTLLHLAAEHWSRRMNLAWIVIPFAVAGLILMIVPLVYGHLGTGDTLLVERMEAGVVFFCFIGSAAFLLFAPQLHFRTVNPNTALKLNVIATNARWFEYAQLPIAILALTVTAYAATGTRIEALFALWMCVTIGVNGIEQARGGSTYKSALNATDRSWITYLGELRPVKGIRVVGIINVALALAIILVGAWRL